LAHWADGDGSKPALVRAFWDRAAGWTRPGVLLCGSAVRTIQALQEERAPLYGRFGLVLREHLVRLAARGALGDDIVDIGRWWRDAPPVEIDAVALAGRSRRPVLVGEAKWTRHVDGARLRRSLERKADGLPDTDAAQLRYSICARERVTRADDLLPVTAGDIFDPDG
jgi:hypothetical protein